MMIITVLITIFLASLRVNGIKTQTFQAISHLFMGALFVMCFINPIYWIIFIILSGVELLCFIRDFYLRKITSD